MQSRSNFFVFFLILTTLLSCSQSKENPEGSLNDVQFAVPKTMDIEYGSPTISFRVQFNKAPKAGDQIVLGSLSPCAITNISNTSFDVNIASLWPSLVNGNYTVSIKRGNSTQNRGEMKVVVNAGGDLTPAAGSTVYGKVTCEGKGIPNVSVSDGIEVVRTDKDGVYQLKSKKYHKYVFVSVPSGYEPYAQGLLPIIHAQLEKSESVAERVDFQLQKVSGQENHTMLVLGDIHLARRTNDQEQFKSFVKDMNAFVSSVAGPVYALTLGDMTWDKYWKANSYGYKEYLNEDAKGLKNITVYHTIGNHDHSMFAIGDYNTVAEYKKVMAPTYYSFNIGNVHYVVLDDVLCTNGGPDGTHTEKDDKGNVGYARKYDAKIDDQQLEWLKKDLSYVSTATPLVVTMHIPLYNASGSNKMENASDFAKILSPYSQVQLFTAHTHVIYNVDKSSSNHIFEHNAGSVCGTWWWTGKETPGIHIGQDGSPGGYSVVKVNGTSFSWQYKGTGYEIDHQFRTYDRNKISITVPDFDTGIWGTSSSANEVYINVWNYDPSWKVEVSENGTPLTVSKETVLDPLHLLSYTVRRGASANFVTTKNSHTFKVKATSASSTLEIKVTDRFGNVYTETMTRPKAFTVDEYKIQ